MCSNVFARKRSNRCTHSTMLPIATAFVVLFIVVSPLRAQMRGDLHRQTPATGRGLVTIHEAQYLVGIPPGQAWLLKFGALGPPKRTAPALGGGN